MKIALVAGGATMSGISRYASELHSSLMRRGDSTVSIYPPTTHVAGAELSRRFLKLDLERFFQTYPLRPIRGNADVFHLTYQSLASALWSPPRQPVVVTVHDIFPYLDRDNSELNHYNHRIHRWMDAWAMRELRHADALVTDSDEVRVNVVRRLRIPPERIHAVPLAVDHSLFRPIEVPHAFMQQFGLDTRDVHVLHVSSEEPRKNVRGLLRAWNQVASRIPRAVLVKVGRPQRPEARSRLLADIAELGLGTSVRIVDEVSNAELVLFYNMASAFAFPSIAEGFGFPVLEAMACGTPVVCSDAPALRELTGDAAIHVPAEDTQRLADELVRLLSDESLRNRLREAGLARAALFTWERTAEATYRVYLELLGRS